MSSPADLSVRLGERDDADAIGRLLHDFNVEFEEPTPSPPQLARRIRELLDEGQTLVLIAGHTDAKASPASASAGSPASASTGGSAGAFGAEGPS